jgi:hypothetical protein
MCSHERLTDTNGSNRQFQAETAALALDAARGAVID